jgi:hypothetical protein
VKRFNPGIGRAAPGIVDAVRFGRGFPKSREDGLPLVKEENPKLQ